jgi:hypothetical protein
MKNVLLISSYWTVLLRKIFGMRLNVFVDAFAVSDLLVDLGLDVLVLKVWLT